MPNSWSKQAYVQGFYCESISFKKEVNMFEHMEISESIYEDVVETSSKKLTRAEAYRGGHSSQNRVEATLSQTRSTTSESAGRRRKQYVDSPSGKSKTCLIHGPGYSSYECKDLGDFCARYAKGKPTKKRGNHPVPRNKFNRQKNNNSIVNSAVDEILLHENKKVSAAKEAPEFLESDNDENELYHIYNISLCDTKEKI